MRYKRIREQIKKMKDNNTNELLIFNSLYNEQIPKYKLINIIFDLE